MYFKDYLDKKGVSDTDYAKKVGSTKMTIGRLRKGLIRKPKPDLLRAIDKESRGRVTEADFVAAYYAQRGIVLQSGVDLPPIKIKLRKRRKKPC